MAKKSVLWVLLAVLSVAAAAFSRQYFTGAFPLLSIDIRMDRQAALARAAALAAERRIGPTSFRDAASFSLDGTLQTFVELEGGGKPAFAALIGDPLYAPYRWRVRHFNERETSEATLTFAPDGTADGFVERMPEEAPGADLSAQAARAIAESAATSWNVDLSHFQPVEQSQERRSGGRVDHTFVYERPDRQLGEGRYRLRLGVSGERLTELTYFVKVPDAFLRRYEQMRSVNTAIGIGGSLAFLLLYGVGGIAFGLFLLARQHWVIWRQPIVWGVVVASAQTLARLNEWPLVWMEYDTALSSRSFLAQQAGVAVAEFAATAVLFSLSFMAAESLTRRAFPRHPQFWRLWSRQDGRSPEVAARTVAGYLLVPVFIAYEVALYLFATRVLNWWTPSEALFNPDVLAAYSPWFSAIARSFQAGFWEESLFRAIPIAAAALIGDRLGHRRSWIAAAFVVQAVIFGAGHAPYPTQPAYARPVELVVPSIAFGLLYLKFGLLPGIILHFSFDAFWFAMPLFAASAPGIVVQRVIIVFMIFVPLWIVLYRRMAARGSAAPAGAITNGSWQPEAGVVVEPEPAVPAPRAGLRRSQVRWIAVAGLIAAVAWGIIALRLPVQRQTLRASRLDAARAARQALESARLGPDWRFHPVADDVGGLDHRFVWTTAGRSIYASLLGSYLNVPGWRVLVRTFSGDVADRAENWTVHLDASGAVQQVSHELPESRAASSLDEEEARQFARRALAVRFPESTSLKEVSAVPAKLPGRTDWTITFADNSRVLPLGELRLSARIMGDEIADARRFVFVPEEWERTQRNAQTIASVIQGAGGLMAVVLIIAGAIAAVVSWSRRRFAVRVFLALLAALVVVNGIRQVNSVPALLAALSTAQPLQLQLAVLVGSSAVGLLLQSAALALVAGVVPFWSSSGAIKTGTALTIGVSLGAIGAAAAAASALPGSGPVWPSYEGAATFVPFIAAAAAPVAAFLARTTIFTLVVAAANRMTAGWTRRRLPVGLLLVVAGGVLGNGGSALHLAGWTTSALLVGLLMLGAYIVVLRDQVAVIPLAAATMSTAGLLRTGWLQPYPGALAGAAVAVAIIWLAAYAWFRALSWIRDAPATPITMPVPFEITPHGQG